MEERITGIKVLGAATANGVLAGLQVWLSENQPTMQGVLLLLQIGVAAISIAYIAAKTAEIVRGWRKKKD